ncbi:hypothetical protein FMEXI_4389 [Fusarium mexicanum]|uniref:Uncharacterized protein n=1 Tax=Fusarium mexicanum TaxID=751941 RepID=A0A8H5J600_9HYPO|nr:hypothetical protein FMEXI_4389 [Fusarium mexicanum]
MHWGQVADLRDTRKVRGVYPPLDDKYTINHKQYRPQRRSLDDDPATYLRREIVDTNDLSYCEVYSIPPIRKNHCALVKTAPRSGAFVVSELERKFDYWYAWRTSLEARMSGLIWKSWETAVNAQSLSPTLLRRVWIDRVMNKETKLVV